ncbi:hypothetical protein Aab01nite_71650 [Paractinoplanes abujensis]|uniref:DUF998 domain-containing protein n=1 Tax=Paractinoplanes abujensis TaxID=882441 RepID=A0A7W7CUD3_9ACTN|nr:DUF998 domain-containing protein [Actinoplanes abujensis]MBB4694846.1 hypothetical protein [Actinoplanes abujensis]GID23575.1 hypothetical protein Aab01nite_71650 [Actinoplanes abujensis]
MTRVFAGVGAACVAASLAFYAALHVVPPSASLDWSRRTISQYALLENGWWFDAATLLLAAGSVAVLAAARRAGVVRGGAAVALLLWALGLVGVVWFEKHNWAVGPSMSGDIHRIASVVAFLSLPVAALLASARSLRDRGARRVAAGGVVSLLCFSPILWAVLSEPWTGVRWWRAIPLGTVERALGLAEVVTLLLIAAWAVRGRVLSPSRAAEVSQD